MADCDGILPFIKPGWTGVEIGVSEGKSSLALLKRGVRFLYLIDPWGINPDYPESIGEFAYVNCRERLRPYDNGHQFAWLRMTSAEAAVFIPEVDFVFVDGNHRYEYCKSDLELYWPKVRAGGVLCGHDYCDSGELCQVLRAVDEFVASRGLALTTFPNISSCWVVRK